MKLVQAVASITGLSRRRATVLIDEGKVFVNGKPCSQYSLEVDEKKDKIEIKNLESEILKSKRTILSTRKHYFAFHKPKGIETTLNGKRNSISPFILKIGIPSLKPVGRLDLDSEGLLLLSDDGDFIYKMTHPSHEISKIYEVWIKGLQSEEQLNYLKEEFILKEKHKHPHIPGCNILILELKEGKNRQIRRTCAKCGLFVERILRIAIGNVQLNKLKPGEWITIDPRSI